MSQEVTIYTESDVPIAFNADILAGQLAESSIEMYAHDFKAYLEYAGTPERALRASTLEEFRTHLSQNTDMSPNTINRMLAAVKRIMKGAYKQGKITREQYTLFDEVEGVRVVALKEHTKFNARTRITPAQMNALTEAPGTDTLVGLRDTALLHTLASSGLRASELASLTISQIKPKDRGYILEVRGKNDEVFREAHLSAKAQKAIQAWLDARPLMHLPFIFTSFKGRGSTRLSDKPMTEVAVWQTITKYAQRVGLDSVKPHDFRRFVGTQLAKEDIRKAQKALGHKDIRTTAKHYVLDELEPGLTDNLY